MAHFPRYAIYYAPPPGTALDHFGAELLGYDAFNGDDLSFPGAILDKAPDWRELTSDPRKYGFHATLKAPFALTPGRSEADLISACATFAATPRAIPVIAPIVGSISGFIAVIPSEPPPALIRLAADCVGAFDRFRAPLTDADRVRRNPSALTQAQRQHLDRWGYPYVMEEFRFHMTLTCRLDANSREPVLSMLRDRFAATGLDTLPIDNITLFRQDDANARFRIIGQYGLAPVEDSALA